MSRCRNAGIVWLWLIACDSVRLGEIRAPRQDVSISAVYQHTIAHT